jgi:hypothetical protein
MARWVTPVDPECPKVAQWMDNFWGDPMSDYCGCGDEFQADFEKRHIKDCKRCQEYGAANIDVEY